MAATSVPVSSTIERRALGERRSQTVRALVAGGWHARRRNPRRAEPARVGFVDWHASRWFAAALVVLLLSMADTLLTLVLVQHGAIEINPLMAPFVVGNGPAFAFLKLALTSSGVMILVVLTRVPTFGRLLAGPVLVGAALLYTVLLSYEMWLLDQLIV
ncbi:MAG TPA: DUF5658 family protein [Steroidobacteraceae bacterium]|nr:DUF5658 family protein [Steroidobacteraceae bacterium]